MLQLNCALEQFIFALDPAPHHLAIEDSFVLRLNKTFMILSGKCLGRIVIIADGQSGMTTIFSSEYYLETVAPRMVKLSSRIARDAFCHYSSRK